MVEYLPMIILYVLSALALIGIGFIGYMLWKNQSIGDSLANQKIGELKNALAEMKSEKDEQAGKAKQLFAEFTNIKAERDQLQKRVHEFEEQRARREKEQEAALEKLATAERNFEAEKARVIREEEERRTHEAQERDRMWNEHENKVISELTDLCNQPQLSFQTFDNQNLPEGFHGSLKPDFMIAFLEQYVIFDVKVSEAKNLSLIHI